MSYTRDENLITGIETTTKGAGASMFARLTPKSNLTMDYSSTWTTEEGKATRRTGSGSAYITYRPTRVINMSARYILTEEDKKGISQIYTFDWLPFSERAVYLSLNYQNSKMRPDRADSQTIGADLRWTIRRNVDLSLGARYTTSSNQTESTSQTYNVTLNARF